MQICECDKREEPAVPSHSLIWTNTEWPLLRCNWKREKSLSIEWHDLWIAIVACILMSLNGSAYTHVYTIPPPKNKRRTCSHPSVGLCAAPPPSPPSPPSPFSAPWSEVSHIPSCKSGNKVLNVPLLRKKNKQKPLMQFVCSLKTDLCFMLYPIRSGSSRDRTGFWHGISTRDAHRHWPRSPQRHFGATALWNGGEHAAKSVLNFSLWHLLSARAWGNETFGNVCLGFCIPDPFVRFELCGDVWDLWMEG